MGQYKNQLVLEWEMGTDLFISTFFNSDTDEREFFFVIGVLVLHPDELEIESDVHAVTEQRLQHHCPSIIIFLLIGEAAQVDSANDK